jgi:hypothetical protein
MIALKDYQNFNLEDFVIMMHVRQNIAVK